MTYEAFRQSKTTLRTQKSLIPIPKHETQYAKWWGMTGSNRRHPACKAGALPAELIPRNW